MNSISENNKPSSSSKGFSVCQKSKRNCILQNVFYRYTLSMNIFPFQSFPKIIYLNKISLQKLIFADA